MTCIRKILLNTTNLPSNKFTNYHCTSSSCPRSQHLQIGGMKCWNYITKYSSPCAQTFGKSYFNIQVLQLNFRPTPTHLNVRQYLRYVGVIHLIFRVLQILPLKFTQQNLCYNNKSKMKHQLKPYKKLNHSLYLLFIHVFIISACFVESLINYRSLPNHVHYWVWSS